MDFQHFFHRIGRNRNSRTLDLCLKSILLGLAVLIVSFQFLFLLSCMEEHAAYFLMIEKTAGVTVPEYGVTDLTDIKIGFYGICVNSETTNRPTCLSTTGKTAMNLFMELTPSPLNKDKTPLEIMFALTLQKRVLERAIFTTTVPLFLIGGVIVTILIQRRSERPEPRTSRNVRMCHVVRCMTYASLMFTGLCVLLTLAAATSYSIAVRTTQELVDWFGPSPYTVTRSVWSERCMWALFGATCLFMAIQWFVLRDPIEIPRGYRAARGRRTRGPSPVTLKRMRDIQNLLDTMSARHQRHATAPPRRPDTPIPTVIAQDPAEVAEAQRRQQYRIPSHGSIFNLPGAV